MLRNTLQLLAILSISAISPAVFSPLHAQSPTSESLFVAASVDNDRPYLGQQITYVFTIYQAAIATPVSGQVRYESPAFAGFWNSQRLEREQYSSTVNSREYRVVELRTALFPTVVGSAVIGPGALTVSTGASEGRISLKSDTVSVHVQPLPGGAPADFAGAVGSFSISAQVDTTTGKTGEPVLLKVVVSGEGNIEALPDPAWPEFLGWRVVEFPVRIETKVVASQVVGSRTYSIALVPQRTGELSIPQIGYTHFDPETGEYMKAMTAPISVAVAGADGLSATPGADPAVMGEVTEMRAIKPVPSSLRQRERTPTVSAVYWAGWGIPPMAVVGALVWRRRRAAQEEARSEILRRSALPDARAALARGLASGIDPRTVAASALLSYLSARLELPAERIARPALLRRLEDVGVSPDLRRRVEDALAIAEAARFAPSAGVSGASGGQAERAVQLLDELEEGIRA